MNNYVTTYVIHYTQNKTRKKFLSTILEKENFSNIFWVEEYDKEKVTYQDFRDHFDITEYQYHARQPVQFPWMLHKLKPEEVSVSLKHKLTFLYISVRDQEYALVLEDDILLEDNFIEKLNSYISTIPNDWDVAFIGQAVDKRIPEQDLVDGVYWYKKEWPADRCADSYLIKTSAARKILRGMDEFGMCFPLDHELSYWFRTLNLNVYWLEPPITSQGSQCGVFETFQEPHSRYNNPKFKEIRSDIEEIMNAI